MKGSGPEVGQACHAGQLMTSELRFEGYRREMGSARIAEVIPEWDAFAAAARERHPDAGTWCEAWTVRDVVIHQAGNAEELARVLNGHLDGAPVCTRSFEEREGPYRSMNDSDLWSATIKQLERLAEVSLAATSDLDDDTDVAWTGRTMKVPWFAEHMREELVLHRWDLTGDDSTASAALEERWLTEHSVMAVGRPLLARGAIGLDLGPDEQVECRLRVEGSDDIVVAATPETSSITFTAPEGDATLESDAATRCLFLWGRRPADSSRWRSNSGPKRLGQLRRLLSGY
jgi:hypothetical protein